MKFAFQMDPLDKIDFKSDSTWDLMKESINQNIQVFFYTPKDLFWKNNSVFAKLSRVEIEDNNNYHIIEETIDDLRRFNCIFIRQDPPYDMAYLTTTYLLEKIRNQVLIVNDPKGIRDFPEKISVLDFSEITPPTLVASDTEIAYEFVKEHSQVIAKPLYSFGGKDVFSLNSQDSNFISTLEHLLNKYNTPFILQKFIELVTASGDKRIILIDGKPEGIFTRKPQKGSVKTNLAAGGTAFSAEFSKKDLEICSILEPFLKENGLFFAGIDIIDNYLIEINITSPTGLLTCKKLYNRSLSKSIIEKLVTRLN